MPAKPKPRTTPVVTARSPRVLRHLWAVLPCLLVLTIYFASLNPGHFELRNPQPADAGYNLLVQGLQSGQLSLKLEPPSGLVQLPDPYDPQANAVFRLGGPHPLHDLSYYHGKLFLYFGIAPALVLFWPYHVLTGQYLSHSQATLVFASAGFLIAAILLFQVRRRSFPALHGAILCAALAAFGLVTGMPLLLGRADVYEVAISCGFTFTMLGLFALWRSLEDGRRFGWLWLASAAFGLAIASRPILLPGAVILFAPVLLHWRESKKKWLLPASAFFPVLCVVVALLFYNFLRFGNPLEFGMRYQLSDVKLGSTQLFSPRFLWSNLVIYFFHPAQWVAHFPFIHPAVPHSLPAGHYEQTEYAFGIFANVPFVLLALALPAFRRTIKGQFGWFILSVAALFLACGGALLFFFAATARYQLDFLPALVLLAITGLFLIENAPPTVFKRRLPARLAWITLLVFSVFFNVLATFDRHADARCDQGNVLDDQGQRPDAIAQYQAALKFNPDCSLAHSSLGIDLGLSGQTNQALGHLKTAVQLRPGYYPFHYNLASYLARIGNADDAVAEFEQAISLMPNSYAAHLHLASALLKKNRLQDAILHFEKALELNPGLNGSFSELSRAAWLLATSPDASLRNGPKAFEFAQRAVQIASGRDPSAVNALAAACAETGQFANAVAAARQALALAQAQSNS